MTRELVLQTVRQWTFDERLALVQEVLNTLQPKPENAPFTREKTLHKALGLAATDEPAPTDAEVEQWLDEHRMERYA